MQRRYINETIKKFGTSPWLFWGKYNEIKQRYEEEKRAFRLSDVMGIKGIVSGEIKDGYVIINDKYKISLRFRKETIIDRVRKYLAS